VSRLCNALIDLLFDFVFGLRSLLTLALRESILWGGNRERPGEQPRRDERSDSDCH
jgi:hypothetical protein